MQKRIHPDFPDLSVPEVMPGARDCFHLCQERIDDPQYRSFDIHYPYELGLVLEGRVWRELPDGPRLLEAGQVWMAGMWEPHGVRMEQAPAHLLVLFVRPDAAPRLDLALPVDFDWVAPFQTDAALRPRIDTASHRERLIAAGQRLIANEANGEPQRTLYRTLGILEVLALVQENWDPGPQETAERHARQTRLEPAMELLIARRALVSTSEAAAACGMNIRTFSRAFDALMGQSFADYARVWRLRGAAHELASGAASVKQVVADWGFKDDSWFSKAFSQHFGCTPGQWRQRTLSGF